MVVSEYLANWKQNSGAGRFGRDSRRSEKPSRDVTYVVFPGQTSAYKTQKPRCDAGCVIELRGDAFRIYAYLNGTLFETWSRSDLYLQHPSIQLNAEVHARGDTIEATLTPIRTIVAGRVVHPTCAFTTRGIEPAGRSTLTFRGKVNDAGGAFVNLSTGKHGDRC